MKYTLRKCSAYIKILEAIQLLYWSGKNSVSTFSRFFPFASFYSWLSGGCGDEVKYSDDDISDGKHGDGGGDDGDDDDGDDDGDDDVDVCYDEYCAPFFILLIESCNIFPFSRFFRDESFRSRWRMTFTAATNHSKTKTNSSGSNNYKW